MYREPEQVAELRRELAKERKKLLKQFELRRRAEQQCWEAEAALRQANENFRDKERAMTESTGHAVSATLFIATVTVALSFAIGVWVAS